MAVKRSIAAIGLAFLLAVASDAAIAQSPNASEGEEFLKAVKEGNGPKALELANQAGSRVISYKGYEGETALHIATRKRELDWVAYLLSRGADSSIGDSNGDTPLMVASSIGFEEAAAEMLRRKAKVDASNRRGETALTIAVQQRQARMVELLLQHGANPDKADHVSGYTPRDYARRDTRNPQLLKLIETVKPAAKKAVAGPKLN